MHEFAHLVARAAETIEYVSTGAVHDVDLLVDFVDDVHDLLVLIAGKFDRGCRPHQHRFPPRSGSSRGDGGPHLESERDVLLKIAHRIEDLKPIHPPVAYVHEAVIAHPDAMRRCRSRGSSFPGRSVHLPLAQVVSGLIKHHDAKIITTLSFGMPIGDINVAIMRIESDFRHAEELR